MAWVNGWWSEARKVHLHAARMGGVILPIATVVHSTCMHPDSWDALLHAWATNPGKGNAATFGIGLDEDDGVVQWAPISRNTNHAGGKSHGVFQVGSASLHPNLVTVSIEVHNAGMLRFIEDQWWFGEGTPWKPYGRPIPGKDVVPDPIRPGRGWHKPTEYQLIMLSKLLGDLDQVLQPLPKGMVVRSGGKEKPPAWAATKTPRYVSHAYLDPDRRSDPGPLIMAHLNKE